MKAIFLDNKRVILLFLSILIIVVVINLFSLKKDIKSSNVYEFSTLKEGDIIPFNSRIVGNFNLHLLFKSSDNKITHYYKSKIIKANQTNVFYCKSSDCLENNDYKLAKNLFNVGNGTYFDYNVSNYKDIFGRNNNKYTGWEVHFLPFEYINEDFHSMYIGTYYDIALVPTSDKINKCLDNIKYYGKSNKFEVIGNSDSFNIDNNNFYLKNNTKGYIDIKFSAKEGDIILFDLNTNSDTLKLKLNDKDLSDRLNLWRNNNYFRYNTKFFYIIKDGEYILHIEEDTINDKDNDVFERLVNIKNFTIFTPSNKEDSDIFYTDCGSDYIIGKVK